MPLHHYLPASFLARFSQDPITKPARDRLLIIGDKKTKKWFKAPAGRVGCIRNLYTLFDYTSDPEMIDRTWEEYENKLPPAIEKLMEGRVDAEIWIRVLVPFVACMLVRGPDFIDKFNQRFHPTDREAIEHILTNDNANQARLIDLQRLLGFVAAAKWNVISSKEMFITNDLGYSPFYNPISSEIGMGIPLDSHNILAIVPLIEDHPILQEEDAKWVPIIHYSKMIDSPEVNKDDLNKGIVVSANRFIFGPNEEIIKKYLAETDSTSLALDSTEFGFPGGKLARAHEFTWHRLVTAIRKPPSDKKGWNFPLDVATIHSGWHSMMFFPMNLVEFPPALRKAKNMIYSNFYDPEIYYTISHINELIDAEKYDVAFREATIALSIKLSPVLRARILSKRGFVLEKFGKPREAIKDFEEAINLDPSNPNLYVRFGYVLLNANRAPRAYKILSKAIKLDPRNGTAYLNRCIALRLIGRRHNALEDSNTAIRLLPDGTDKANAFLSRGEILKELGYEDKANEDFSQADTLLNLQKNNDKKPTEF
jgi:hypothetical protein